MITHASLFSGIGGFDLAAEWIGWENIFQCEKEDFCRKVLNYYWPKIQLYGDIKETDFSIWRGRITVLTGGFPCQPFSHSGKRKGTKDNRYLWPEMLRAIREIQPAWIVGENVYGLLNWNEGLVFEQVLSDLESEEYEVIPVILPACGQNAPHKRERIWFVAYSEQYANCKRPKTLQKKSKGKRLEQQHTIYKSGKSDNLRQFITNPNKLNGNLSGLRTSKISQFEASGIFEDNASGSINKGLQGNKRGKTYDKRNGKKTFGSITKQIEIPTWSKWPTQSPICSRNDGFSLRLDGITFSKWRNESIKGYGNAVVPQLVYKLFETINYCEHEFRSC